MSRKQAAVRKVSQPGRREPHGSVNTLEESLQASRRGVAPYTTGSRTGTYCVTQENNTFYLLHKLLCLEYVRSISKGLLILCPSLFVDGG